MKTVIAFLVAMVLAISFSRPSYAQAELSKRPNVLFIVCDDLNTTSLPCYGNTVVKAPNIDRLASMGVRFERAYCQWPLCLPSRNSFLSGRRPDGRFPGGGLLRERIPDVVYLPEYFRKNGYFTGRVGKMFHTRTIFYHDPVVTLEDPACWDLSEIGGTESDPCGYAVRFSSVDKGLPSHPELAKMVDYHELLNKAGNPGYDYWIEMAALNVNDDQCVDGNISKRMSELLEEHAKAEKPWFLAAGFRRPHLLWVAPRKYFDMYRWEDMKLPVEPEGHIKDIPKPALTRGAPNMTDEQRKKAIACYYALVSEVDDNVGRLLATMDRLKLWDNTIVIFTSDHGWHLDEHGLWGKVTLFEESARVPMIIIAPGIKGGQVCDRPVEMLDFYPTLTELAGLPAPTAIDGMSIVPQLKDPQAPRDRPAYSVLRRGQNWGKAVYTHDWRYTEWGDQGAKGVELYDLKNDMKEYHNLAKDPQYAATREKLKKRLDDVVKLRDKDETKEGASD